MMMPKKKINNFAKEYLTFSSQEVIAEFEKVSIKNGNIYSPIVDVGINAEIVHGEGFNPKKPLSPVDAILYFTKKENAKEKERNYLYFEIKSCTDDLVQYDLLCMMPLDFEMKMTDGSKLYKHIKTQQFEEKNTFNNNVEYFTDLVLNKSALNILPITLNGISRQYNNKIVKEVFENLYKKSLKQNKIEDKTL